MCQHDDFSSLSKSKLAYRSNVSMSSQFKKNVSIVILSSWQGFFSLFVFIFFSVFLSQIAILLFTSIPTKKSIKILSNFSVHKSQFFACVSEGGVMKAFILHKILMNLIQHQTSNDYERAQIIKIQFSVELIVQKEWKSDKNFNLNLWSWWWMWTWVWWAIQH